jgi:hypothetical protein
MYLYGVNLCQFQLKLISGVTSARNKYATVPSCADSTITKLLNPLNCWCPSLFLLTPSGRLFNSESPCFHHSWSYLFHYLLACIKMITIHMKHAKSNNPITFHVIISNLGVYICTRIRHTISKILDKPCVRMISFMIGGILKCLRVDHLFMC